MLGAASYVGFIPVRDLEVARVFYIDTLGLTAKEETPGGLIVDAGGTMLRIASVGEFTPQPFTIAGWRVLDISETLAQLAAESVETLWFDSVEHDEDGVWTAPNGDRVAWFGDPDGNVLSLTQFAGRVVDEFWV